MPFHFAGCLEWRMLALFNWDVQPLPGVPSWHLTGVPMKRRICISNTGRAILPGIFFFSCSAVIFSVVCLSVFFFSIIIIWLFSNASVRNVYRMRTRGVSEDAALRFTKHCDAYLSAIFEYKFEYKSKYSTKKYRLQAKNLIASDSSMNVNHSRREHFYAFTYFSAITYGSIPLSSPVTSTSLHK